MLHILVFFLHVLPIYAISSIPSFYHSSEAILEELNNLSTNCPGATLILTTTTKETSTIPLTIATFTSKQTPDKTPHNRAMIIFGEHARELISPETALRMAQDLCGMNEKTKELALKVLESTSIAMVPIANPLGRKAVEDSWENMCQRVNENGVDLNRNWDAHWEAPLDKSDYNYNADTNSGPKPFSEPETQALKKILDDTQPTIFITVHSGTLGMYTPYAYSRDLPTNDPSDLGRMKNILDALDPEYCKCPSGAAGLDVGKYSKRRRSNVAVIIVRVIFISVFLFYYLFSNHSFPTNPNSVTNCFKLILSIYNFTTTLLLRRYFDF